MKFLKRFAVICVLVVIVAGATTWLMLCGSLAQLDGELALAELMAPVQIIRDHQGVVTIHAENRLDAALATGFVHAQERFFQMDLMRRLAAGELAALFGDAAVDHDMGQRIHRMRHVARQALQGANDAARSVVDAYTIGVNAGIGALWVRPFEYLVLRERPAPWRAEDTVLVVLAMYFRLHDERATREAQLGRLHAALPVPLYAFLTQAGTEWDAPLIGEAVTPLPVPGAELCDVRRLGQHAPARPGRPTFTQFRESPQVGSNAWAISPRRSHDAVAILANDMHLGLSMPNTWFRLRLLVSEPGNPGFSTDVSGVTLPGTPAVVAGSNGKVAWGLTNSYGDWVDRVVVESDPLNPHRYRTPDGYQDFQESTELIQVRGGEPRTQVVRGTIWGPVIEDDASGALVALRWLAHEPEATNLELLGMEQVSNVEQAMEVAHRSGIPPQNLLAVDSSGNIAWTLMGKIPRRQGYDPLLPGSWAETGRGWFGWLSSADYPEVVNPPSGAIWTANARVVDGGGLSAIGDGGYALGARAMQIRDRLLALESASEADMLDIQLDDRAVFLARWRRLLLDELDAKSVAGDARRGELRAVVQAGGRRAGRDDAGYRLVRSFRRELAQRLFTSIVTACGGIDASGLLSKLHQWEGALWRMLEERPQHLLDARYVSWKALILEAADAAARSCGHGALSRCTWGEANTVSIRHPLSRVLPPLAGWLDIAPEPLPGDTHMPRVQGPAMGASERFAVSPGRESSGYFHMPGGQSGHPLSPFYRAGHHAWVEGRATPFLPGAEQHRLTLKPAR